MRITNWKKIGLGLCTAALVASCSISTTMDASIDKDVDAATKLREEAKLPAKIANQDLVRGNDDIWLGNTSLIAK